MWSPRGPLATRVFDFVADLRREWSKDRVGGLAAEIAFFSVLGLFPAVLVVASALGSLDALLGAEAAEQTEQWVVDRVVDVFGTDNTLANTITELFEQSNPEVLTVGVVLSLYAASRGFVSVVKALDVAYDHDHLRGWLSTRLVGFALTVFTVLVASTVMTLVVVGPLLGNADELADDLGLGSAFAVAWSWARWPVVALVLVAWAATVYHVAPNHRSPWRWELPGAALATLWWLVVSVGFRAYLDAATSGSNAVYGLLGGALSLLLWLYLLAMGLLAGAEVNSLLASRAGVAVEAPPSRQLHRHLAAARRRLRRPRPSLADDEPPVPSGE